MAKIVTLLARKGTAMLRLIMLIIAVAAVTVVYSANQQDKTVENAVAQYISVASSQYNRGLYETAKEGIEAVKADYSSVLTEKQTLSIDELLGKLNVALEQRELAELLLVDASDAMRAGDNATAVELLNQVVGNKFASDTQKQQATAGINAAKAQLTGHEVDMRELFHQSYQAYKTGDYDTAKAGFEQVAASGVRVSRWFGQDSNYFLGKIAEARSEVAQPQVAQEKAPAQAPVEKPQEPATVKVVEKVEVAKAPQAVATAEESRVAELVEVGVATEPVADSQEQSYIRVVQEKRDRQRDYTNAIVSDSVLKANEAVAKGDYPSARNALAVAYSNIDKTKMLLGDDLYNQYKGDLDRLSAQIQAAQDRDNAEKDRVKRIETEEIQETIRRNVEMQRQSAVKDYLANAMAFQREQRYKEALAQLNALLAIDPLNSIALLQKQTIEETILWREQLAIQKEKHQEEIQTLLNADRASIPYSDEVTYPRNWKQIVERRKSHQDNDFAPEDMAVYRALEQVVDLTSFYEDMTFGEAIEILANSMEPRVTIVVLWSDLDMNAFVDRNTPINLRIPSPVRARLGLNLLLSSVAGGLADISYVVTDGVIRVATAESLPDKLIVRRYDIRELMSPSAEFSFDLDTSDYGSQGEGRSAGGGGGSSGSTRSSSTDNDQDYDAATMRQEAQGRAGAIIQLIQETVEPMSWYDAGGDASLTTFSSNVLVIRQSLENHEKIRNLLDELRSSLGEQVSIEARFLTVTENFLEQIGLDLDMLISPSSGKWNDIIFSQSHADGARTQSTGVPGSLPGNVASTISGGYILDDLQVSFILEATQAHKDSKNLNAPKVTVLSGESAAIRVQTAFSYVADYDFQDITAAGDNQPTRTIADPEIAVIRDGVVLNVSPTITSDKKYVLLRIMTSYTKTDFDSYEIPSDSEASSRLYTIQLPVSQIADVRTRVTVPDGGTLLIGGQKLTGEVNTDQGVPVLSKLPFVGRLFENRGRRKDSSILLILVKPTIILQDEQERDAIAAMENRF